MIREVLGTGITVPQDSKNLMLMNGGPRKKLRVILRSAHLRASQRMPQGRCSDFHPSRLASLAPQDDGENVGPLSREKRWASPTTPLRVLAAQCVRVLPELPHQQRC
jgi:hypothetical protein